MAADLDAVTVDDRTGLAAETVREPAAGVAVGDEADVVAVGLRRHGKPRSAASARTIAFDGVSPSGNMECAICSAVRTPSTYDWSFARR